MSALAGSPLMPPTTEDDARPSTFTGSLPPLESVSPATPLDEAKVTSASTAPRTESPAPAGAHASPQSPVPQLSSTSSGSSSTTPVALTSSVTLGTTLQPQMQATPAQTPNGAVEPEVKNSLVESAQPDQPVQPIQPVQIDQAAQVVQPIQTVQAVQPVQTVQAVQAVQPTQPIQPVQPVQSVQTVPPVQPGQPLQPLRASQTAQPMQPVQPPQPMEPSPVQPNQTLSAPKPGPQEAAAALIGIKQEPRDSQSLPSLPASLLNTGYPLRDPLARGISDDFKPFTLSNGNLSPAAAAPTSTTTIPSVPKPNTVPAPPNQGFVPNSAAPAISTGSTGALLSATASPLSGASASNGAVSPASGPLLSNSGTQRVPNGSSGAVQQPSPSQPPAGNQPSSINQGTPQSPQPGAPASNLSNTAKGIRGPAQSAPATANTSANHSPEGSPPHNAAQPNSQNGGSQAENDTLFRRRPGPTCQIQVQPGVTVCQNCLTTTTPLWRRDENGAIMCNACGLFLKLHGRRRPISLKTDVIKSRNRSNRHQRADSSVTPKKRGSSDKHEVRTPNGSPGSTSKTSQHAQSAIKSIQPSYAQPGMAPNGGTLVGMPQQSTATANPGAPVTAPHQQQPHQAPPHAQGPTMAGPQALYPQPMHGMPPMQVQVVYPASPALSPYVNGAPHGLILNNGPMPGGASIPGLPGLVPGALVHPMSPQTVAHTNAYPHVPGIPMRGAMSEQLLPRSPENAERIPHLAQIPVAQFQRSQQQAEQQTQTQTQLRQPPSQPSPREQQLNQVNVPSQQSQSQQSNHPPHSSIPQTAQASVKITEEEHIPLMTRVSELELVNDLLKRRVQDLESSESQARAEVESLKRKVSELQQIQNAQLPVQPVQPNPQPVQPAVALDHPEPKRIRVSELI